MNSVDNGIDKKIPVTLKSSDYTGIMDVLFTLRSEEYTSSGRHDLDVYQPLLFLTTMPYQESTEWVQRALTKYGMKYRPQDEEPGTKAPIDCCLVSWQNRKSKK